MKTVTIITVCYNSENTIEQTIKSVLEQTYSNIEYILIDGKSTDDTLSIVKKYSIIHPNKVRYLSEPDTGIYNAMNKGIAMAKGELIGIINSDDWYDLTAVQIVVDAYNTHGPAVYHGIQRTYKDTLLVGLQCTNVSQLDKKMIEHPTCFVPKFYYEKYGPFDESYQYTGDYEFMLRLKKFGVKFILIENVLANFREGGASHNPKAVWENYRLWLKLGLMSNNQYLYRSIMDRVRLFLSR
ncbi:glycosyltransferase family 2 protein [Spirosoma flavum]|uniref:Glycosyltransferase family 2 protein n=1 Tax=Spirosoma flavum TaxID=2048557 RepID=A0ABW6AAU4_9BACT